MEKIIIKQDRAAIEGTLSNKLVTDVENSNAMLSAYNSIEPLTKIVTAKKAYDFLNNPKHYFIEAIQFELGLKLSFKVEAKRVANHFGIDYDTYVNKVFKNSVYLKECLVFKNGIYEPVENAREIITDRYTKYLEGAENIKMYEKQIEFIEHLNEFAQENEFDIFNLRTAKELSKMFNMSLQQDGLRHYLLPNHSQAVRAAKNG